MRRCNEELKESTWTGGSEQEMEGGTQREHCRWLRMTVTEGRNVQINV